MKPSERIEEIEKYFTGFGSPAYRTTFKAIKQFLNEYVKNPMMYVEYVEEEVCYCSCHIRNFTFPAEKYVASICKHCTKQCNLKPCPIPDCGKLSACCKSNWHYGFGKKLCSQCYHPFTPAPCTHKTMSDFEMVESELDDSLGQNSKPTENTVEITLESLKPAIYPSKSDSKEVVAIMEATIETLWSSDWKKTLIKFIDYKITQAKLEERKKILEKIKTKKKYSAISAPQCRNCNAVTVKSTGLGKFAFEWQCPMCNNYQENTDEKSNVFNSALDEILSLLELQD